MSLPSKAELRAQDRTTRSWIPRSWAASAIFLLLATVMVQPVLMAFFLAYVFSSDCFLTACRGPQPGAAMTAVGLGLLLTFAPFAGVRFFQADQPVSAWTRAGILAAVVLVGAYLGAGIGLFPFVPISWLVWPSR
jgi:hypothetical protein